MIIALVLLATLFSGWRIWRRLRYSLHVLQLHGYKLAGFVAWVGRRPFDFLVRTSHGAGAALLLLVPLAPQSFESGASMILLAAWCVTFASSRRYRSDREKKPLAYTNRMRRLLAVSAVIAISPVAFGALLGLQADLPGSVRLLLAGFLAADLGAPLWVTLSALLLEPVEASFRSGFKRKARRKLADQDQLTIVGVTGSYGKTSVKFMINEILGHRYHVLATPGSYNTPMGICKVINDMLRPEHQVLVVEMGARYPGDIAELCDLVTPDIAVVTNVGVAHLESMGSVEAIAVEKGTIVERVNPDGHVVLNHDDDRVRAMSARTTARIWTTSALGMEADLQASEIRYGPEGARFTVRDSDGHIQEFRTALLGHHNVSNLLQAAAVGRAMGLRLRQIAHAVERIQPVRHRLELRREGPILVIDDAFNSNPVGARNAVEILGQFDTGRRIIVTPGMIELGEREEEENHAFGSVMADNVDLAILIGPQRTLPIAEGLRSRNFPQEKIRVFASLFDARDFLTQYLKPGDIVLYENDLPDHYDEAA